MNDQLNYSWTTTSRFVIEFLIIVIGVLAALAVVNWNDGRQERQLEQEYLQGLAIDLRHDLRSLKRTKEQAREFEQSLRDLRLAIQSDERPWSSDEEFVEGLIHSTYLGLPKPRTIAIDEVKSTGSLRLLVDVEFRRKLADYYSRYEMHGQHHPEYRRKEAAIEEELLGLLPLTERVAYSDDPLTAAEIDIESILQEMRSRSDLVARIEDMIWVQYRVRTRYQPVADLAAELLNEIEGILRVEPASSA